MKYNQPYGVSDPNGAYVNGNPTTGTMGSIPPAEAIEYPQREIVNFIADTLTTPANTDLRQLSRAVQSNYVNYAADVGTTNQVQVTLKPIPLGYFVGLIVRTKMANEPTGPSTLNCNALGAKTIKGRNGADIKAKEWQPGDIVTLIYDGTYFQIQGGSGGGDAYPRLQAPAIYYVNGTTGSDTLNDGLTALKAFKTLQRAVTATQQFNLNGFSVTVFVADGTYNDGKVNLPSVNGSGVISFVGNTGNPSNVSLVSAAGSVIDLVGSGTYTFTGFRVTCSAAASGDPGYGFRARLGTINVQAIDYGQCVGGCMIAAQQATIFIDGPQRIQVAGQTVYAQVYVGGFMQTNMVTRPAITLVGGTSFASAFALASFNAILQLWFSSITGTATGKRYAASMNGVIAGGNASGTGYFPGSIAGTLDTGGQYE